LTLSVARLSALIETDAKKVVALSTLRQLGLIFIALAIGRPIICFFHIIIHAFAKANLFIIVGRILHRRFSQQDARLISSRRITFFITITITISLVRLVGIIFISGFFSKEQILIGQSSILRR
jgi:NADH:ubiquinone oxidoreductase subunit 5 (subunit L)/multisubunit Na+/H+ antiporter MnhA subunit